MICCPNFSTLPKFLFAFLLLEARNSLSWRLVQPRSSFHHLLHHNHHTSSIRLLPPRFFFHRTLLLHHKKLLSYHLYGATKLLQALPPLELAQEARAPWSFSIIWYHELWSSRAKFLIFFILFVFSVLYTTFLHVLIVLSRLIVMFLSLNGSNSINLLEPSKNTLF